jgi:hypothetical protein
MTMIVETLLGSSAEPAPLSTVEVCVRSLVVFGFAILMVRLATRRFLSQAAPLDVLLGVLLGAALSRAITGPSPMILAMACVIVLALVHRLAGPSYRRPGETSRAEDGDRETKALKTKPVSQPSRFEGGPGDLKAARVVTLQRGSLVPRR